MANALMTLSVFSLEVDFAPPMAGPQYQLGKEKLCYPSLQTYLYPMGAIGFIGLIDLIFGISGVRGI
jgi:hypothetical protein